MPHFICLIIQNAYNAEEFGKFFFLNKTNRKQICIYKLSDETQHSLQLSRLNQINAKLRKLSSFKIKQRQAIVLKPAVIVTLLNETLLI